MSWNKCLQIIYQMLNRDDVIQLGSGGGGVVKLLACITRGRGFEPGVLHF